ncbi:MAG: peptidylprolyl isomerase [Deltaproteobacteria bacterium]|nr:peptidylprolyl isomerase [Deltaproteobacteria bacterium]
MKIEDKARVAIDYALTLDSGEEIDRSDPEKPLGFIVGAGQIIPGLEKQLAGLEAGAAAKLTVEPADGYGEYREELKQKIPRTNFPEKMEIEPGMIFQGFGPNGPMNIKVIALEDDQVLGDFNHPLAGERLNFDVKVKEVREATKEELDALANASCSPSCCSGCDSSGSCDSEMTED